MELTTQSQAELVPPNPIRVETALSRFPVHRLAKHGDIAIDIREKNHKGEVSVRWEVTHNSKYGQPGPLAYKLDTLIINRRIEEVSRPIPRIIKLGSLREIITELGFANHATEKVRKALRQNAFAAITAKIKYRQNDGTERSLEADFTRYGVVFTGEKLPDGRKADAVYILLNDIYIQVINGAMTRPLDYDYLKALPPASQRFYELLSFQMYAAIKNDRPRAKLLYSELCRYAPLTRQTDWNIARPQLARIHAPHKKSGYIARIDFQDTTDSDGKPDWIMLYQPGPKARAEFRTFTRRGGPVMLEVEPLTADPLPRLPSAEPSPIEAALIGHGITPTIAGELVRQHGEEKAALQVEHLEWMLEKKPGKIADPAAWLCNAIRSGIALPKSFVSKAERQRRADAKAAKDREAAEVRRQEQAKAVRERHERQAITAYWDALSKSEQAELDAKAKAEADPAMLELTKGPMSRYGLQILRDQHIRKLLQAEGKLPAVEA